MVLLIDTIQQCLALEVLDVKGQVPLIFLGWLFFIHLFSALLLRFWALYRWLLGLFWGFITIHETSATSRAQWKGGIWWNMLRSINTSTGCHRSLEVNIASIRSHCSVEARRWHSMVLLGRLSVLAFFDLVQHFNKRFPEDTPDKQSLEILVAKLDLCDINLVLQS